VPAVSETQVWLLRHGASTFNAQHRCQGSCDEPELTPQGREQACLSAERLSPEGIETVISSPLRRASETAWHLLKAMGAQDHKITFETDARLREIDLYGWERLPLEEIPRRFSEQHRDWRLRPGEFRMQFGNQVQYPVRSLYDRVRLFWNYLLTAYAGKSILLVSHGGTIRALIASALGLGAMHFHSFQQSNCGVSRLRFRSDSQQPRLDLLNDTAHLGEQLPKLKEGRRGLRLLLVSASDQNPADIGRLAAALHGIVIDNFLVVGSTARNVASQLFAYAFDSCRLVSEAAADAVAHQVLHYDAGDQLRQVAILGPPAVLRHTLRQQLDISDTAAESLDLRPLGITSLHRPGDEAPPVLQTVNMLKAIPRLVSV
jgi:phosphoserine phosphatase